MEEKIVIRTERLYVRTWRESDLEAFYHIMSNPGVHKYTGEDPWTMDDTKSAIEWLIANKMGHETGYFNCPLVLSSTGQMIGRVGLNSYLEDERIPEIEWILAEEHWGKGYSTEIGKEMINYAFKVADFNKVIGITMPGNTGSIKAMEKIGMKFMEEADFRGGRWSFYGIDRK